jgi:hypothetical protein
VVSFLAAAFGLLVVALQIAYLPLSTIPSTAARPSSPCSRAAPAPRRRIPSCWRATIWSASRATSTRSTGTGSVGRPTWPRATPPTRRFCTCARPTPPTRGWWVSSPCSIPPRSTYPSPVGGAGRGPALCPHGLHLPA